MNIRNKVEKTFRNLFLWMFLMNDIMCPIKVYTLHSMEAPFVTNFYCSMWQKDIINEGNMKVWILFLLHLCLNVMQLQ